MLPLIPLSTLIQCPFYVQVHLEHRLNCSTGLKFDLLANLFTALELFAYFILVSHHIPSLTLISFFSTTHPFSPRLVVSKMLTKFVGCLVPLQDPIDDDFASTLRRDVVVPMLDLSRLYLFILSRLSHTTHHHFRSRVRSQFINCSLVFRLPFYLLFTFFSSLFLSSLFSSLSFLTNTKCFTFSASKSP
jgi:hypothetical protein